MKIHIFSKFFVQKVTGLFEILRQHIIGSIIGLPTIPKLTHKE